LPLKLQLTSFLDELKAIKVWRILQVFLVFWCQVPSDKTREDALFRLMALRPATVAEMLAAGWKDTARRR